MMRWFTLLFSLIFLSSCAGRGNIAPPEMVASGGRAIGDVHWQPCFPVGHWQFVHNIRFEVKKGGGGTVLGVLDIDDTSLHCALLTVEGLTLFAGSVRGDGPVVVSRALPPFDRPGFAAGLFDDIRRIFRRPPGKVHTGVLADGTPLIRYQVKGRLTDILRSHHNCWTMKTYRQGHRQRTVAATNCRLIDSAMIAGDIELVNFAGVGYSLHLHLLSAERIGKRSPAPQ